MGAIVDAIGKGSALPPPTEVRCDYMTRTYQPLNSEDVIGKGSALPSPTDTRCDDMTHIYNLLTVKMWCKIGPVAGPGNALKGRTECSENTKLI